jgi:hypothetical protein
MKNAEGGYKTKPSSAHTRLGGDFSDNCKRLEESGFFNPRPNPNAKQILFKPQSRLEQTLWPQRTEGLGVARPLQ